jgi:two-component system LytT family response regulator
VAPENIMRCQGENNYTRFFLEDQRQILVCQTLREYEDLLKPQGFLRVHQSNLVNLKKVKSYIRSDGGYLEMQDGSKVPVSRLRKDGLLKALLGAG